MAKIVGKGTVLKQTISASLTAVAQVLDISFSGTKAETYDSTALDDGVFKTKAHTGYTEPGSVEFNIFYDPNLAGHKFVTGLAGYSTTGAATNVMTVTYTDGGTTVQSFTALGWEISNKIVMNDGVKMTVKADISGDPGFSHP